METMDRRTALALGAAIFAPSVLMPRPAQSEMYARHAGLVVAPGVRRLDLGRCPSPLLAYHAITVTDYIFAPGSTAPAARLWHDTIYHVLEGEFRIKKDQEFSVKSGGLFVCASGEMKEETNTGEIDAVLRAISLCEK